MANTGHRGLAVMARFDQTSTVVGSPLGGAPVPRTCDEASLSSPLASRPINCFERWRKTQIWWLPRVRLVLDIRAKTRTMGDAIYRGFLDRIVVDKDSNLFLIYNRLYHMKICDRIKSGKFGWALPGWTQFRLTPAGLGSPRVRSGYGGVLAGWAGAGPSWANG
jgi:hypothetical protein